MNKTIQKLSAPPWAQRQCLPDFLEVIFRKSLQKSNVKSPNSQRVKLLLEFLGFNHTPSDKWKGDAVFTASTVVELVSSSIIAVHC